MQILVSIFVIGKAVKRGRMYNDPRHTQKCLSNNRTTRQRREGPG
jgi:hypothetical protein